MGSILDLCVSQSKPQMKTLPLGTTGRMMVLLHKLRLKVRQSNLNLFFGAVRSNLHDKSVKMFIFLLIFLQYLIGIKAVTVQTLAPSKIQPPLLFSPSPKAGVVLLGLIQTCISQESGYQDWTPLEVMCRV